MKARTAVLAAVVLLAALSTVSCRTGARTEAISDEEISLYRGSVFETKAPEWFEESPIDPGDGEPVPRSHREMPPVVPHLVTDFLNGLLNDVV